LDAYFSLPWDGYRPGSEAVRSTSNGRKTAAVSAYQTHAQPRLIVDNAINIEPSRMGLHCVEKDRIVLQIHARAMQLALNPLIFNMIYFFPHVAR
jgi:hypothetical protein